jgi:preprotein translocase subunit YajC
MDNVVLQDSLNAKTDHMTKEQGEMIVIGSTILLGIMCVFLLVWFVRYLLRTSAFEKEQREWRKTLKVGDEARLYGGKEVRVTDFNPNKKEWRIEFFVSEECLYKPGLKEPDF